MRVKAASSTGLDTAADSSARDAAVVADECFGPGEEEGSELVTVVEAPVPKKSSSRGSAVVDGCEGSAAAEAEAEVFDFQVATAAPRQPRSSVLRGSSAIRFACTSEAKGQSDKRSGDAKLTAINFEQRPRFDEDRFLTRFLTSKDQKRIAVDQLIQNVVSTSNKKSCWH